MRHMSPRQLEAYTRKIRSARQRIDAARAELREIQDRIEFFVGDTIHDDLETIDDVHGLLMKYLMLPDPHQSYVVFIPPAKA